MRTLPQDRYVQPGVPSVHRSMASNASGPEQAQMAKGLSGETRAGCHVADHSGDSK